MRLEDWGRRLEAHIMAFRDAPFVWGQHDCCTFAAGCVEAVTGVDPMEPLYGLYDDRRSAVRIIRGHGGLAKFVDRVLQCEGFGMTSAPCLMRGDVCMVRHDRSRICGVVLGSDVIVPGLSGLMAISRDAVMAGWRIH